MEVLRFDLTKKTGAFKPLNAVNNGPCHKRHASDQYRSNFDTYKAARIPFARNHDAAFSPIYGGEHTVDISAIFPDFDADPNAPESYDFACTDEYVLVTLAAGTETFYRLGQKIEHTIKKYHTLPPKDFHKWAVICEHIIRHYNDGWADGYRLNIRYWEIWNEPDLDTDDSADKRTWGGTKAQFFDFYEVAAKHLKKCFPHLMIGGPALAHREEWAADFLAEMRRREVPIDFFSWHIYTKRPARIGQKAEIFRKMLDQNGYANAQNILNEWNYVKDWTEEFVYSLETIGGIKGAAFTMAAMSVAQASSIDMLMYFDAGPNIFNGMFHPNTLKPLKGYYPFKLYGMLYDLQEVKTDDSIEDIYTLCGCDEAGKAMLILTYFTDEENMPDRTFCVDLGKTGEYERYLLDEQHDVQLVAAGEDLTVTMQPNTVLLIKEK